MPRRRRHHLADEVFEGRRHVVSVTICSADHGRWLIESDLAQVVCDEIRRLHNDHPVLAFCLMPDHVHLIVCNAGIPISRIVGRLKGRCSREVRQIRPALIPWQKGYWDHIIRRDEGLYSVLQYVLMNPVRKGLVENWWEWRWLGSPMIGEVGPNFFGMAAPEDIMWSEILRVR